MKYQYNTKGVCARQIEFDLKGDKVHQVRFMGGCNGNLKAISSLVEGLSVEQIESVLLGNTCGGKPTSCADQLAIAVRAAYNDQQNTQE